MSTASPTAGSTASAVAACCSPLTNGVLDAAAAEALARMFKALGDPARVRLLSLIAASDGGEACICDLTGPVGLSQPTVSHHMRLLADAGLVSREQRGKWAYFRVVDETLNAISQSVAPLRSA
ncbi:MAG TPA: metalloregulator ArsR/SmtB family transcription factor [Microlunatus sp.]|nr:metalloregulator ArsR/SmtB family transcription factor [Microlunatus sp.]